MNEQKDSNAHRAKKRSFQANLRPVESDLVNEVKRLRGLKTDRELLVLLCRLELVRHGHPASSVDNPKTQQDFLRDAMKTLGLSRSEFADHIGVKKRRLDNWLLPDGSKQTRKMPDHMRIAVGEVLPF